MKTHLSRRRSRSKPTFDRISIKGATSTNVNPHRQHHRHILGQSDLESEDNESEAQERNVIDVLVPEEGISAYNEASSCSFIDQRCQVLKPPEKKSMSPETILEQDTFKDIYVRNTVKCDSYVSQPHDNSRSNNQTSRRSPRDVLSYIVSKIIYILVLSLVHLGVIYFSLGILGILMHVRTT